MQAALDRDRYCRAEHLVPQVRCAGRLDPHEIIPRSAWAAGYLELGNVLIVCRSMHEWVTNHTREAQVVGLYIPRHAFDLYGAEAVLAEAAELREAMRRGDPSYPSWFADSERVATPLPHPWERPR